MITNTENMRLIDTPSSAGR